MRTKLTTAGQAISYSDNGRKVLLMHSNGVYTLLFGRNVLNCIPAIYTDRAAALAAYRAQVESIKALAAA